MSKPHEWEHLAGLIEDFPPKRKLSTDKSLELLRDRTKSLVDFNVFEILGKKLYTIELKQRIEIIEMVILAIHSILFKRILSNPGKYRSCEDPGGGRISFGGSHRAETRNKYSGCNPNTLKECVNQAIGQLFIEREDKIESAVRFYQQFVLCHPFYDANGRIARLIIDSFLSYHGFIVLWSNMVVVGKAQFIKRLNRCHDRYNSRNQDVYERQLTHFVNHMKKFIIPKTDLGSLEIPQ